MKVWRKIEEKMYQIYNKLRKFENLTIGVDSCIEYHGAN